MRKIIILSDIKQIIRPVIDSDFPVSTKRMK